jgi:membrane dipeptidase
MNFPVFDLHCDTAYALLGHDHNSAGSLRKNEYHVDLERAKTLAGYAQCFACFTSPLIQGVSPTVLFERELATIQREIYENKDLISLAYSASQIEENHKKGKMSAVLTLEGPAGIGYDPELLQDLQLIGFRMTTLTWNEKNPLAGSHLTGGGLTDQGREFVKEAQRLGMLIDVSHISDEAFWNIMDITNGPIVASHSNSRSFYGHSRNLTDDMFKAICQTGGVAGFNQYAEFVGEMPTLDTVCDHILHLLEMDFNCQHLSLGADLDGCDTLCNGFDGIQSYPMLADRLLERGVTDEMIRNLFWNNAWRVMDQCCT